MKKIYSIIFILLCLASNAQDTTRITQSFVVGNNSVYTINPGTVLVLAPKVRILVDGSLVINATKQNPVTIISEDFNNPAEGFVVKGNNYPARIDVSYTNFSGLVQPFVFDPFWSRSMVSFNNISILKSSFNEPLIYVSSPYVDLNKKVNSFKITNSSFINNNAGIIVESVGSAKTEFEFSDLSFYENNITGKDSSLGLLHLQLSDQFYPANLRLSNLAFNRNSQYNYSTGLSVAGTYDTIVVNNVYAYNNQRPIYDNVNDRRITYIKTNLLDLSAWPGDNVWIKEVKHVKNLVTINVNKPINVSKLFDSTNTEVPFTSLNDGESTLLTYNGLAPVYAIIDNKYQVKLPEPFIENIDSLKPDDEILVKKKPGFWVDSSDLVKIFPKYIPTFEVGVWGGIATYFGDIKHKFGIPGSFDWSYGANFQYNFSRRLSVSLSAYSLQVSMSNPSAAFYIWQAGPVYITSPDGSYQKLDKTFSYINFITEIKSIDLNLLWNLRTLYNHETVKNNKIKITPVLGFGAGFLRYDPFRNIFYDKNPNKIYKIALRELGTEGQNFLPGKSQYSQTTGSINTVIQLNFSFRRFHLKSELRYVFTFTDYLDDYGSGLWYGGDYKEWVRTNGYNISREVTPIPGKPEIKQPLQNYFFELTSKEKRTNDLLTDSYVQIQAGLAYDIGTLGIKYKGRKTKNTALDTKKEPKVEETEQQAPVDETEVTPEEEEVKKSKKKEKVKKEKPKKDKPESNEEGEEGAE